MAKKSIKKKFLGFFSKLFGKKKKRKYSTRRLKKRKEWIKKALVSLGIFLLIMILIGAIWFKKNILDNLPDISHIERISLSQASVITDRHWEVLYRIFEENRKYVPLSQISPNMINAIVAIEDKNFWSNPGIDIYGITRAAINDLIHRKALQGWSTLTQQLIKNLLLDSDRKIERKLKEITLALKINSYLENKIKKQYSNLSGKELQKKVKEKILELYLNYIFLGNNNYGIETASQYYFDTSSQDLSILQAAILASIPKAPSKYNPISNPELTLGKLTITNEDGEEITSWAIVDKVKNLIKQRLDDTFLEGLSSEKIIKILHSKTNFKANIDSKTYQISYQIWRKDLVLARMLEDGYISQQEFIQAFLDGLTLKIVPKKLDIKAPHFVFYVIDILKQKYWEDKLRKGGLTIKTTLDMNVQKLAQQSIDENYEQLKKYWATNAAMVFIDSHKWEIIAYVGSKDYFDKEIDGNVDMVRSPRQPGSTVKPLVYALGFMKHQITPQSPIYDIPIKLGKDRPNNFDWQFWGWISIAQALAGSRNIPAIKMLLRNWGEAQVKKFFRQLGMQSIDPNKHYGYPLAIWAAEVPMIELATAYTHLSASWKPAPIDPILEIRGPDGTLLYSKKTKNIDQIIPPWVAYIIWEILSNKDNFPPSWRYSFSFPGIPTATKSGTTNTEKKKLPRDWWFVAYTPYKVAVFWAGNTNGTPMKSNAFWATLNSPIWKSFWSKLKQKWWITPQQMPKSSNQYAQISKFSGKQPSEDTPYNWKSNTLAYIPNLPNQVETEIKKIEIDALCNWLVSPTTPAKDIKTAYVIKPVSLLWNIDQQDVLKRWEEKWIKQEFHDEALKLSNAVLLLKEPSSPCPQRDTTPNKKYIKVNLLYPRPGSAHTPIFDLWLNATSDQYNISQIGVFIDSKLIKTISILPPKNYVEVIKQIKLPSDIQPWTHTLKLQVFNPYGYYDEIKTKIKIVAPQQDTQPPKLLKNPYIKKGNINIWIYDDLSSVKKTQVFINDKLIDTFTIPLIKIPDTFTPPVKIKIKTWDVYDNVGVYSYTL